jgi:hypothetical protein
MWGMFSTLSMAAQCSGHGTRLSTLSMATQCSGHGTRLSILSMATQCSGHGTRPYSFCILHFYFFISDGHLPTS